VTSFVAALQFLTLFPWPKRMERSAEEVGQAAIFFPVIGLFLGLCLVLVNWLLRPFATAGLASVALVALLVLLTRGLHLDGLADTFDGLGAGGDRERVLRVMDDSHTGVFGLVAVISVILFKVHAIESMGDDRWRALLSAPLLSRWAMILLAHGSKPAKDGLGSIWMSHIESKHFLLATVATLVLIAGIHQAVGIAMMLWVAVFATGWKRYFHRRLGGLTGDTFGAVGELSEASVLVLLALAPK
jgi:adenosylcobinamide-GDP ribazoletransferase